MFASSVFLFGDIHRKGITTFFREKEKKSNYVAVFLGVVFVENVFSVSSSSDLSEHTSEMLLKVVIFCRLPDLTSLQNICGVENKSLDGPVQKRNAYFSDTFARARLARKKNSDRPILPLNILLHLLT